LAASWPHFASTGRSRSAGVLQRDDLRLRSSPRFKLKMSSGSSRNHPAAARPSAGASGSPQAPASSSQQEILENEFPFPPGERAAASAARYLPVRCLRPGFHFDHLIKRIAVRTREGIVRRRPAFSHDTLPNTQLWCVARKLSVQLHPRNCHAFVTPDNHSAGDVKCCR
jgi:hypothetical protein